MRRSKTPILTAPREDTDAIDAIRRRLEAILPEELIANLNPIDANTLASYMKTSLFPDKIIPNFLTIATKNEDSPERINYLLGFLNYLIDYLIRENYIAKIVQILKDLVNKFETLEKPIWSRIICEHYPLSISDEDHELVGNGKMRAIAPLVEEEARRIDNLATQMGLKDQEYPRIREYANYTAGKSNRELLIDLIMDQIATAREIISHQGNGTAWPRQEIDIESWQERYNQSRRDFFDYLSSIVDALARFLYLKSDIPEESAEVAQELNKILKAMSNAFTSWEGEELFAQNPNLAPSWRIKIFRAINSLIGYYRKSRQIERVRNDLNLYLMMLTEEQSEVLKTEMTSPQRRRS